MLSAGKVHPGPAYDHALKAPATLKPEREDDSPSPNTPSTADSKGFYLRDVLTTAYEYHGMSQLCVYLFFFVLVVSMLFVQWSPGDAINRSEVISSFKSFGPSDWQQSAQINIASMASAASYFSGYCAWLFQDNLDRNRSTTDVRLNEYNAIQLVRLRVNLDACRYGAPLACFRDTSQNLSTLWSPFPAGVAPSFAYGPGVWFSLNLYDKEHPRALEDILADLTLLAGSGDLEYLGMYALTLSLEVVARHNLHSNAEDGFSWYTLSATHLLGQQYISTTISDQLIVQAANIPLRPSMTSGPRDHMCMFIAVVYAIFLGYYITCEVDAVRRVRSQYHGTVTKGEPISYWFAMWMYIRVFWNVMHLVSTIINVAVLLVWAGIMVVFATSDLGGWRSDELVVSKLINLSWSYSTWLYAGMANILVTGMRMYQFMHAHQGLRVYYSFFVLLWIKLKDFIIWFVYVLILLGIVVMGLFQVSGGNPDFMSGGQGLSSMARLTFGFYDYATFVNNNLGIGAWGQLVVVVFWLVVVLLIVIAQNLLIVIVGDAYTESVEDEGAIEATMVWTMMLRFYWYFLYFYKMALITRKLDRKPGQTLTDEFVAEILASAFDPKTKLFKSATWKLLARWAIVLMPEARTLQAYFTDSSTLLVYVSSPWEEPQAVGYQQITEKRTDRALMQNGDDYSVEEQQRQREADRDSQQEWVRRVKLQEGVKMHPGEKHLLWRSVKADDPFRTYTHPSGKEHAVPRPSHLDDSCTPHLGLLDYLTGLGTQACHSTHRSDSPATSSSSPEVGCDVASRGGSQHCAAPASRQASCAVMLPQVSRHSLRAGRAGDFLLEERPFDRMMRMRTCGQLLGQGPPHLWDESKLEGFATLLVKVFGRDLDAAPAAASSDSATSGNSSSSSIGSASGGSIGDAGWVSMEGLQGMQAEVEAIEKLLLRLKSKMGGLGMK